MKGTDNMILSIQSMEQLLFFFTLSFGFIKINPRYNDILTIPFPCPLYNHNLDVKTFPMILHMEQKMSSLTNVPLMIVLPDNCPPPKILFYVTYEMR